MDTEKAKEMLQAKLKCMELEDLKAIEKGCNGKCEDCHLNYEQGNRGEQKEAMGIAIAAMELQTPRVPNLEGDGYSDGHLVYDTWICPHCESRYEMDYEEHKHCPECGQKINWEFKEEAENEETE